MSSSSSSRSTLTRAVKAEAGAEADGNGALLNIKVTSQSAPGVPFRIKRNVKLRRLMDLYCGKHSLDPRTVVFLGPEGDFIRPAQTPDEVGLKDGDDINIMLYQDGGAAPPVHTRRVSA